VTDTKDPQKKREEIRVVDRRTFTQDGQRRVPDAPAEEPVPAAAGPPVPAPAGERGKRRDASPAAPASRAEQVASAHFKNLVLNLATTAAANLGEMPSPFTQKTEIDIEGARQVIDLLQALHLKTRGNLTAEETSLLDSLLYDLQMKYVSLQTKASKPS